MAKSTKKEAQEVKEVKLTPLDENHFVYQIALRLFGYADFESFNLSKETQERILNAIREETTPDAGTVDPGSQDFNRDIYLTAIKSNEVTSAIKAVILMVQEQAEEDYEREAILRALFFLLTAASLEATMVNTNATWNFEEKLTSTIQEATEEAARLSEELRKNNPELFALPEEEQLPHIKYKRSYSLKTDSGKLANQFFSALAPQPGKEINGQISMIPLDYGKVKVKGKKKKEPVMLFYDFKYDEEILKANNIPKGFYGYEFFVGTVLDNLYDSGNNIVSFTKILAEMGIEKPGQKHVEKLYKTLQKGLSTAMQVNNKQVQEQYGNGDRYGEFTSHVYNIAIYAQRFLSNGYIADAAVKINDFTPFRILSNSLNEQLRAWDKDILKLYSGRKTDRYWSVLQYLIHEIGYMRSGARDKKITYSHFHARMDDKTARDKQLSKKMLFTLLDEVFKPTQYITRYEEAKGNETPGVILTLGKGPKQIEQS